MNVSTNELQLIFFSSDSKVMVATDAIGMGLNLSIRRIIFYSLIKPMVNEKGEKEMDTISVSQALQIAGRAGRYGTQWPAGFVTSFKPEDLSTLQTILSKTPEPLTQAGLHPTADQIELYAYHLPNSALSNLMVSDPATHRKPQIIFQSRYAGHFRVVEHRR